MNMPLSSKSFMAYDDAIRKRGYERIAGVDEVGVGPLAGPLVSVACILPPSFFIDEINDSKKLSPQQRLDFYRILIHCPSITWGIGIVNANDIDEKGNIRLSGLEAMAIAISKLTPPPDCVIVDGKYVPPSSVPSQAIIKGDNLSQSIMAASILAKVTRDTIMETYDSNWPEYRFSSNKGYPTPYHLQILKQKGPSPIHRKSFKPVKEALKHLAQKNS